MTLVLLIVIPLLGGLASWLAARANPLTCRWISILTLLGMLGLAVSALIALPGEPGRQLGFQVPWIPQLGITFALFADGLSLPMILLGILLALIGVIVSWNSIHHRVGSFHFNILWVIAGANGLLLAADLFVFFVFWEIMVVPMAFIIAFWGEEEREAAATKFFLFTQLSALLMLISIVGLAIIRAAQPGLELSFLYTDLLHSPVRGGLLMKLGFFIAFAVKLPVVPFHVWLGDAYTRAPLAGSIIMAGFLAKTGGYGLMRFGLPLFPEISAALVPWAFSFGVITIIYGALLAFGQTDAKRLVAYSSLSHMGFIMIGAFSGTLIGFQGALFFMISHGFAIAGLFILVDAMQRRLGHRDIEAMGGIASLAPKFGALFLFFVLASLGLPASGNFVGEILVIIAAFQQHPTLGLIVGAALVPPAVYSLYFIQRVLHGEPASTFSFAELDVREYLLLALLAVSVLYLGLRPQGLLNQAEPALRNIQFQIADANPSPDDFSKVLYIADHAIPDPQPPFHR